MGRLKIKRGSGKRQVQAQDFRLVDAVRDIQRRAAQDDSRIVTIGPLLLFSTETGDAWILDSADQLATPIAREHEALSVPIEDADTSFAVAWTGSYRIEGGLFIYRDTHSGNTRSIFGYPTEQIGQQISTIVDARRRQGNRKDDSQD
jgi:hypothetical protein